MAAGEGLKGTRLGLLHRLAVWHAGVFGELGSRVAQLRLASGALAARSRVKRVWWVTLGQPPLGGWLLCEAQCSLVSTAHEQVVFSKVALELCNAVLVIDLSKSHRGSAGEEEESHVIMPLAAPLMRSCK